MTKNVHFDTATRATPCGLLLVGGARQRISLSSDWANVTCQYCLKRKP